MTFDKSMRFTYEIKHISSVKMSYDWIVRETKVQFVSLRCAPLNIFIVVNQFQTLFRSILGFLLGVFQFSSKYSLIFHEKKLMVLVIL